ncbi:hypothetical protein DXG03_007623 [Asterophora parasitica]|uniref:NADAR domain-containing protein n=1 Tax=Asterophora parasitica TaxID=117018 RepID=A0A9P7KAP0_9AGAR|nr:hypothetical protein DXG03_007623 [Asterophora parasitica]
MGASSSKAKSKRRQQPLHAPKGYPPYDYRYEQGHLLEPLPGQSEETIVANEEEPKEEPKKQKRGLFGALAGQKSGQKETNKASDYLTQPKPTVVDVRHFTNFTPASRAPYLPPPPPKNTAPQPPKTATTPHAAATLHMASSPVPRSPSHSVAPLGGEEPALKPIYFNQTTEGYTDFLNHSPHRVWLERVEYPTAAHLLQALQFLPHHPDIAESIRLTEDIVDAYQVSVQYSDQIEPGFAESILENTETVALLKFHQHGGLRDMLIETYPVPLIYDDPSDYYWGTGVGPEGEPFQNQLGGVLERIRERMIQESRR